MFQEDNSSERHEPVSADDEKADHNNSEHVTAGNRTSEQDTATKSRPHKARHNLRLERDYVHAQAKGGNIGGDDGTRAQSNGGLDELAESSGASVIIRPAK
ncbi:hypothetical protein F503_04462 [Ophiostoma piceae UAMH 11346]|uniref:Uncharacterized protein n=1 Tax=Ophiostoma piceae (strain UAMH 11346) TaxID=1262450 RepID=S3D652_OPHP1|nr:hypothetical protein F503_04462 [Ophiostoma piceae UAMH 11346]